MNKLDRLISIGIGLGLALVLGASYLVFDYYSQPHWMQDLVRSADSKHAGETGYIYIPLACFDTLGPGGQIVPGATVTYAYVKLDVNVKTGGLRVMDYALPSKGFKCPSEPTRPSLVQPTQPAKPPVVQPAAPAAPAKK